MTFLNFMLLGGLAAASIPIIIHLINRNRIRVVRWGAMHLLEMTLEQSSRRIQLEQLILLLIRCLIPALLAFALARPVLTGMSSLLGTTKSSRLIVLDNSYSMDFGGAENGNFAQARQTSEQLIRSVANGSDVGILLMAGGVRPLLEGPTFDRARLTRELGDLSTGFGRAAVPEALEGAVALSTQMHHPFREIIVVSDFQRVSWSTDETAARQRILDVLEQSDFPPAVTLLHVGDEGHDNVCVESLDFSQIVLGIGQPMKVRASLKNFGDRAYSALRVFFRVDGKERSATQVSLEPGEQKQLLFTHTFQDPGSHVIEVFAEADALVADNAMQASIPVWDRVPVLLVNGAPSPQPLKGETDFLEIALQPFGESRSDLTDLITSKVITTDKLNAESLAGNRVAILANVPELREDQLDALQQFVRDGGGLLIFPGDRIKTDWYRSVFATDEGGLLPVAYGLIGGSVDSTEPVKILSSRYNHTALELFNDTRNGDLTTAAINAWYRIPVANDEPGLNVIATLENGDPFLVESTFGEGRVIQCSVPCDSDWSNLPIRPFFLPLMQRLTTYLASTVYPPRNIEVGKSIAAILPKEMVGQRATIIDPAGEQHAAPIIAREQRSYLEFTDTFRPGLYTVNPPNDAPAIHYVVSSPREESNLEQLTETEILSIADELGANVANSYEEYEQLDEERRFGQEIWRPVFWAVLALLFLELFLQQRFSDRR